MKIVNGIPDFTNAEHRKHCKQAGCSHPAVYDFAPGRSSQGWCALCRKVAFSGNYDCTPSKPAKPKRKTERRA